MNVFLAFHQTYEPVLGSIFLSAIVAGVPLYVLFVMLAVLRLPAWMCAVASMLTAAVLALLANTAPVAFGSIGIPVVTLGRLVAPVLGHADPTSTTLALSAMVGRQLPVFSIIIPAYLIVVLAGWRRMREVLPAVLVTGVSFAIVQFLISNFVGPELTDIIAALVSMGCLAALLRFWKPREVWQFAHESPAPVSGPRRIMGSSGPARRADLPGQAAAATGRAGEVTDSPAHIARA